MNAATLTEPETTDESTVVKQLSWMVDGLASRLSRKNPSLKEDLNQIGLLALIESSRQFVPGGRSIGSYSYFRVRGAMVDYLRKESRSSDCSLDAPISSRPGDCDSEAVDLHDVVGEPGDQEQQLLDAVGYTGLDAALETLTERERAVITMRFYENAGLKEISAAFKMPITTTHNYLQSTLEKLRRFMKLRE